MGVYVYLAESNANPYASGLMKTSENGSAWTSLTNNDMAFRINNPSTPSYSIDWEINYYPKYL